MKSSPKKSFRPKGRAKQNRTLRASQGGPSAHVNPNSEFVFDRQIADYAVYIDSAGALQVVKSPGFGGEAPFVVGTTTADNYPGTVFAGFAWSMPLDSLSSETLVQAFSQFQVDSVQLHFDALGATTASTQQYPEVLIAYDPLNQGVPSHPTEIEQYTDSRQKVLTQFRTFNYRFVPRFPVMAANAADNTGFGAAYLDNQKAMWLDTRANGSAQLVHVGARWVIRNLASNAATTSPGVRISAHVRMRVRIPKLAPGGLASPGLRPSGLLTTDDVSAGEEEEAVVVSSSASAPASPPTKTDTFKGGRWPPPPPKSSRS